MSEVKLTKEQIEGQIDAIYFNQMGKKTVVGLATLKNGFELVGSGSCVDPANFDFEKGKQVAYEDIVDQIWKLEGYRLQCKNPT